MGRDFENRTFRCIYDRGSWPWQKGRTYDGFEFRKCRFESCGISIVRELHRRTTVRNVKLVDCVVGASTVDTAVIEDVLVENLRTRTPLVTWAAVFKHVTLRGRIGRIMVSRLVAAGIATPAQQRAFDEANAAYYQTVDWALDISEADLAEADLRGVPAHLVRRDPATQVVVSREKALQGEWRRLDLSRTYWPTAIELFLETTTLPATVLVAPKRARAFPELLAGLMRLRDAGVAEPD